MRRLAIALFLVLPLYAFGQSLEFERVLLPISSPQIPGAFGSVWVTEHFGRNDGDTAVQIARDDCGGGPACLKSYAPKTTFHPEPSTTQDFVWLSVEKSKIDQTFFSTIVRDVGKDIEPFGTEIPSVRESQFRDNRVQLLNVPGDSKFRKNLRIYMIADTTSANEAVIAVRAYDMDAEINATARVLGEASFTLTKTPKDNQLDYLAVFFLENLFPNLVTAQRVRIEVERTSGVPLRLWALLTATNNQTQHVTIFTP